MRISWVFLRDRSLISGIVGWSRGGGADPPLPLQGVDAGGVSSPRRIHNKVLLTKESYRGSQKRTSRKKILNINIVQAIAKKKIPATKF